MKRWVKIARNPTTGMCVVTVTVMEDGIVAKWSQRIAWSEMKDASKYAYKKAVEGLRELQAAMADLEEA